MMGGWIHLYLRNEEEMMYINDELLQVTRLNVQGCGIAFVGRVRAVAVLCA